MGLIGFIMKRKLVQQGTSTLMVSLPSKWIKQNNLTKGSEVDVDEKGSELIISPDEKNNKIMGEISLIGDTESLIRTIITNAYRSGNDKIKITFENNDQFRILENTIKTRLIGF